MSHPDNARTEPTTDDDLLVEEDSLVEEVSIDGMCGVY
ncbi:mycofactocin precursor MftA [Phytoactinopolyspora endophytica]|nr:mycofactocin precursor MftA [Phytoactinopolyspora endophytica]